MDLIYAQRHRGTGHLAQVALTCYVFAGVLSLLKGASWLLKEGAGRLFLLSGRWRRPGKAWHLRVTAATVLRALVLGGVGLPYVMAIGMVYRPKVVGSDEMLRKRGYPFEHVTFASTDGVPLDAWWIPAAPCTAKPGTPEAGDWGKRTVVLCHGLGANKANQLDVAINLPARGYNLLTFDFRAHGASGGQISSFGDLERRRRAGGGPLGPHDPPASSRTSLRPGHEHGRGGLDCRRRPTPAPTGRRSTPSPYTTPTTTWGRWSRT